MRIVIINICLIGCLTLGACNSNSRNHQHTSITVKDNSSELNFKATYPERQTMAAQNYVESSLQEERIFGSPQDVKKVEIKLSDGTQFYLTYEPGFISINFDRDDNSSASYHRMRKMIDGFGKALKD